LRPYSVGSLIAMQPSFQAPCNTASPDRFSCRDSGCFRNRGCRDHKLSDGAPVKNIGNRLGRDSFAAGSVVSSTVKVSLRCVVILFKATAIDSFMFTDRGGGVMAQFPRLLDLYWLYCEINARNVAVFVGLPAESAAASDAFIRPGDRAHPVTMIARIGGGGVLFKTCEHKSFPIEPESYFALVLESWN
jgi:hypothetical protein